MKNVCVLTPNQELKVNPCFGEYSMISKKAF